MAHLVTSDVLTPGFQSKGITDERGRELKGHTKEDVEFALRLLAYNNGRFTATSNQLATDYNIKVHPSTLTNWVSSLFTQRYVEIQHELSKEINEKLAGKTTELAAKAVEAQDKALDETIDKLHLIDADKLPSAVNSLAKAASENLEMSQLLNDRPTSIVKHQNPDDAIKVLKELGLVKDEKVVDAEVIEE